MDEPVTHDRYGRALRNLRLSVTDRCNLRCQYCMPEKDYVWLPKEDLLHFEEISSLVDVFISLGVDRVRLTGGEPLLRRNLAALVQMISSKRGLRDVAMTTNGILLAEQIDALQQAGLGRVTVSLDTLRPERFEALARSTELPRVLEGISAAFRVFGGLKIDAVVMRGVNDDEIGSLIEFGKSVNGEVRFIEYMDVGGATRWDPAMVVSRREMLARLSEIFGTIEPIAERGDARSAPADRYRLPDGTTFGIIASTTEPFCRSCDRSRLTADGMWFLCLYATRGLDLRAAIRRGASAAEIRDLIASAWTARTDRGAEDRLALGDRRAFVPVNALRENPHLEMHTRGG
ncbi:MAG TPA: GTP 3',8-cyclase MoaA [Vicinamibacterales bacterium]|jgi:cyclic pyranopterin phosphate synthase|nr:GTP 3',8-cyclase MoaA [Vicinamibacterales bacterium]